MRRPGRVTAPGFFVKERAVLGSEEKACNFKRVKGARGPARVAKSSRQEFMPGWKREDVVIHPNPVQAEIPCSVPVNPCSGALLFRVNY